MNLSERKIKILKAIIDDYVETAEPVGSRTLAKKYDLGISSATIRNEMSDLEDIGLIMQPHASAGRIPSDSGYRLFVDNLMQKKQLSIKEAHFIQSVIENNIKQIDYLMQETAKAVSLLTTYTTIITEPKLKGNNIKHFQIIPVDDTSVALVVVTEERIVKNVVIQLESSPTHEELTHISFLLNEYLANKEFTQTDIENLFLNKIIKQNAKLIKQVLVFVKETIISDEDVHLYLSGVKNILAFPEFSDVQKAKAVFHTLEEKQMLIDLLTPKTFDSDEICIMIGNENGIVELKNCSLIKVGYNLSGHSAGTIGIIGPTRMNYEQVVSVLNEIVSNIDKVIKAITGG